MASYSSSLSDAVAAHQAGDLNRAETLYREVVDGEPPDPDALHLLGVMAHQRGDHETAVKWIEKAIEREPETAAFHGNLGAVFWALGRTDEAVAALQQAAALSPLDTDIVRNLGNVLVQSGRLEEARRCWKRLVQRAPNDADAWLNLGRVNEKTQRLDEAVRCYRRSAALNPDCAAAHLGRARCLETTGRRNEAVEILQKAAELCSENAAVFARLGAMLRDMDRPDDAVAAFRKAWRITPEDPAACNNLGVALQQLGRLDEALQHLRRAQQFAPHHAEIAFNLANVHRERDDFDDALRWYEQALRIDPDHTRARLNHSVILLECGRLRDALAGLDAVLADEPELPTARFNRALARLKQGDFRRGWPEYEWRFRHEWPSRELPVPVWDGSPSPDTTVLVTSEQGIGDMVMFASCLPDLIGQSQRTIVECDHRLLPLFARSFPAAEFVASPIEKNREELLHDVDVQVSLGSLPRFFRSAESSIPRTGGYLWAEPAAVERWRRRYGESGDGLKVGISWRGGKDRQTRSRRSIPLQQWEPILSFPGVRFVNLQYGDSADERHAAEQRLHRTIHHWDACNPLRDLDDFAAQIAALDLVLSVDNSTVHLAAALGRPVWVLLPFACDWRWMTGRDDTPWYPTVKLFRQRDHGDWDEVIRRVGQRLRAWMRGCGEAVDGAV